jgi:D-arabinose 1-dehydrogenase-like Zn-dependent alcohol dehydrogenase
MNIKITVDRWEIHSNNLDKPAASTFRVVKVPYCGICHSAVWCIHTCTDVTEKAATSVFKA